MYYLGMRYTVWVCEFKNGRRGSFFFELPAVHVLAILGVTPLYKINVQVRTIPHVNAPSSIPLKQ